MADEVKVSAPVPSPIKGGPSAPDELLKIYDAQPKVEAQKIEKEAETQAKVKEVAEKKEAAASITKKLDSSSGPSKPSNSTTEEQAEGAVEGEEASSSEEAGEASEDAKQASDLFYAENEGAEIEIPQKAALTFEVNGKPFSFTVKDAIDAKLGQEEFDRNMHRRLSFVDKKEKGVESRINGILEKARSVVEASSGGEFMPALKAIAKMAAQNGQDPIELEQKFLDNLAKIKSVYLEMTPEQKAKYFAERRAETAEQRAKELEAKVGFDEGMRGVASKIEGLCREWNLQPDQFSGLYQLIGEKLVGEGKRFQTLDDVGPEQVIEIHHELTSQIKVEQALGRIDKSLVADKELAGALYEQALQNPKWTTEDLEYIVKQIISTPSESAKNLNRKLEKAKSVRLNSAVKEGSTAKKSDEDDDNAREWSKNLQRASWAGRVR